MDDPELEAIRRARMAELQSSRGSAAGSSQSSNFPVGGMGGGNGMGTQDSAKQQEQAEAQEEMKRQALSTILDSDARERRQCSLIFTD